MLEIKNNIISLDKSDMEEVYKVMNFIFAAMIYWSLSLNV